MKEFRIGIIGVDRNRRGGHAWRAHQPSNGVVVVAGADINPAALTDFKQEFGPHTFICTDYRELLKQDLDAVFVMTPDFLHEEQTVAALQAGKAVYLEKPLALTIDGCDRILNCAMQTKSKLFVGHNMRYFPSILKMKEIIDAGIIGDIRVCWCRHFVDYGGIAYFLDWHSEQRYVNGLLLQKGAHDIDVIHWLMGTYTRSVVGMGMLSVYNQCKRRSPEAPKPEIIELDNPWPPNALDCYSPRIDVEDHNMILMQMENGAQACYLQCHFTPDAERNYTFIGTKGRIENIGDSGDCEIQVWTQRGCRNSPDIVYKLRGNKDNHGGSDLSIIDSFLDFARYGKKPNISPVAARNSVAVGVLGHQSMRNDGNRLAVPALSSKVIDYFAEGQRS